MQTTSKTVLCIKHADFEGPGYFETIFKTLGYHFVTINAFDTNAFSNPPNAAVLLIMGGPMSVNDTEKLPWLNHETAFVTRAIHSGTKVIGVCLGAQLIAKCTGGEVFRGPAKEIGWWPITFTAHSVLAEPHTELMAYHWHGETFSLPENAILEASTPEVPHQIFRIGPNVLALQCHLETTFDSITGFVTHCGNELVPAPKIQSADTMYRLAPKYLAAMHTALEKMVVAFVKTTMHR